MRHHFIHRLHLLAHDPEIHTHLATPLCRVFSLPSHDTTTATASLKSKSARHVSVGAVIALHGTSVRFRNSDGLAACWVVVSPESAIRKTDGAVAFVEDRGGVRHREGDPAAVAGKGKRGFGGGSGSVGGCHFDSYVTEFGGELGRGFEK